jgi:trans-aconitate methyltransferase
MLLNQWDAEAYDQKHAFVFEYGEDLLSLLAPQPGERILDVGCGTGHLTNKIAATGAQVVGLDSSPEMIATGRATYPEVEFVLADASDFSFAEPFDAIFSNAALHWVERAEAAVICMARALRPGGRFVIEMGGYGNIERIAVALEGAARDLLGREVTARNFFPRVSEYSSLLEKHGFEVRTAHLFDRPTRLEDGTSGLRHWIAMFRGQLLADASADERETILRRVEDVLRPVLFRDGSWFADYRRLRVTAIKE